LPLAIFRRLNAHFTSYYTSNFSARQFLSHHKRSRSHNATI
jgi:hypothetical protein